MRLVPLGGLSASILLCALAVPVQAQDGAAPLFDGALVYHGNYCGPGNKGIHPAPVDALDAACMRHDACTVDFELPACSCNERLAQEAAAVARDADAPADERAAASFTAQGALQLPCRH